MREGKMSVLHEATPEILKTAVEVGNTRFWTKYEGGDMPKRFTLLLSNGSDIFKRKDSLYAKCWFAF